MSLEAALVDRKGLNRPARSRGRDMSLSPTNTAGNQLLSSSRSRGRSTSRRRQGSRATGEGDDMNYRWSLLTHDPFERFEGKTDRPEGAPRPDDDFSDEERISDDEGDLDYDVCEVKLPNFHCSINDYYKRRSSNAAQKPDKLGIAEHNKGHLLRKKAELDRLSEVLALEKGLQDAKSTGNHVPAEVAEGISERLKELGISNPHLIKNEDLVKMENRKDKTQDEYKKFVIENSSKMPDVSLSLHGIDKNIVKSELDISKDTMRVSRSITLGDFFQEKKQVKDVKSFIVYMDLGTDSMMALQYTLGTMVSPGDVVYVVNCSDDQSDLIEHYEQQCESLSTHVVNGMNLMYNPNFSLHVVVQSTYRPYAKHFVNQLVKYLKPTLFVISHQLLITTDKLQNYITPCPFQVVKRKARRRSAAGY